jgi:hypothetical protein
MKIPGRNDPGIFYLNYLSAPGKHFHIFTFAHFHICTLFTAILAAGIYQVLDLPAIGQFYQLK